MDGHTRISEGVKKAKNMGQTALALTDHGNLSGIWKFVQTCQAEGIKPIPGMEAYLAIGDRHEKNTIRIPGDDGLLHEKRYEHLTLLATTHQGWLNLIKIHDEAQNCFYIKPRIDYALLEQYHEGIVCLTGCLAGPVMGPLAASIQSETQADRLMELIVEAYEHENETGTIFDQQVQQWRETLKLADDLPAEQVIATAQEHYRTSGENNPTSLIEAWDAEQKALQQILTIEARTPQKLQNEAEQNLTRLINIFGTDRVFVEIMEHGIAKEQAALPLAVDLANRLGVKCVATNDPHYCDAEDADSHDAWIALTTAKAGQANLDNPDRFRFDGEGYWLKTEKEMRNLHGEDWWQEACTNTMLVADMVEDNILGETRLHLPVFPVPEGYTPDSYLKELIRQGVANKYGEAPGQDVKDRVNREYKVIKQLGLSSYFLIVQDFIGWARSDYTPQDWITYRNHGVLPDDRVRKEPITIGPARGSAGGSIIAYVLDITRIDPLRHHLLFERFLDPTRVGMPDIDVDVEQARLPEAHAFHRIRWGENRVARIGSLSTMKPRACIKDAARLLNIPEAAANRLNRTIPQVEHKWPKLTDLTDPSNPAGADFRKQLSGLGKDKADQLIRIAASFDGLSRGEGIHASGLLICDTDLDQIVPTRVNRDDPDSPRITVWDGRECDAAGLLKLDLLGLRNLDVMALAVKNIEDTTGETVVFPDPDDDTERNRNTWRMLSEGKTAGVFQLESKLGETLTMDVGPRSWADLTAINALNRPGPLSAGIDQKYAARRNGREKIDYTYLTDNPVEVEHISQILDPTLGLMPYQESAMLIGQVVAGFGAGNTNRLRKAISKKKVEEFPVLKELFIAGAVRDRDDDGNPKLGYGESTAKNLWEQIEGSAAYSFNASHSAAYALLSFQTAFLKANWPVEYGAALLAVTERADKRRPIIDELAREGISVVAPDVNLSGRDASPSEGRILLGLGEIKGVGLGVAEQIVQAREKLGGRFGSLRQLVAESGLTTLQVQALAEAGALDEYGSRRGICLVCRTLKRTDLKVPVTEWSEVECYARQTARLQTPTGVNPLVGLADEFRAWTRRWRAENPGGVGLVSLTEAERGKSGVRVDVPGVVTRWDVIAKPRGAICSATLTNSVSSVDVWVWSRDLPAMLDVGVRVGSVVRARVEPRVRVVEVEDPDSGEVSVSSKCELSMSRVWVMPTGFVGVELGAAPVGWLEDTFGGDMVDDSQVDSVVSDDSESSRDAGDVVDPYAGAPDWAKPKPGENLTPHAETVPVDTPPVETTPVEAEVVETKPEEAEAIDVWGKTTPTRPAQWNINTTTNTTTNVSEPKTETTGQTGSDTTTQKLCWAWV